MSSRSFTDVTAARIPVGVGATVPRDHGAIPCLDVTARSAVSPPRFHDARDAFGFSGGPRPDAGRGKRTTRDGTTAPERRARGRRHPSPGVVSPRRTPSRRSGRPGEPVRGGSRPTPSRSLTGSRAAARRRSAARPGIRSAPAGRLAAARNWATIRSDTGRRRRRLARRTGDAAVERQVPRAADLIPVGWSGYHDPAGDPGPGLGCDRSDRFGPPIGTRTPRRNPSANGSAGADGNCQAWGELVRC